MLFIPLLITTIWFTSVARILLLIINIIIIIYTVVDHNDLVDIRRSERWRRRARRGAYILYGAMNKRHLWM